MGKSLLVGLFFVCFFILFTLAIAQEATPLASLPTTVEYSLPYPGILPDHPLFFLKALRDQILSTLISNPVRKVEYQQLLADKYLNMGIFLLEKKNKILALATIEKTAIHDQEIKKYLAKLTITSTDENRNLINRFEKSLDKQAEIITKVSDQFDSEKNRLMKVLEQIQELKNEIKNQ